MTAPRIPSVKRWHPYLDEWVIIAPVTQGRPWQGNMASHTGEEEPEFDPGCYLCPGVTRASGAVNPDYQGVYIFDNDFPSLSLDYETGDDGQVGDDIAARGICRVFCFSPVHNRTIPQMTEPEVAEVIEALAVEFSRLAAIPEIAFVMPFESRGKIVGVSNPHPHGQIYATDFVPRIPLTMYRSALRHHTESGRCIFCEVLERELADGSGIVCQNDAAVAFVPSFARHTFEVHLMPRRHVPYLTDLTPDERRLFSALLREMHIRYDNLFSMPFPNMTVFQNAPVDDSLNPEPYHFRVEFYPPLRSPDKQKFMASFETGGGNIVNPSFPHDSAAALRGTTTEHYLVSRKHTS